MHCERSHHTDTLTIPVRREVCFSDDTGAFDERVRKQQLSYVYKLEPLLRRVLGSRESVLYVVRCQWPRIIIDIMTSGWLSYFMNQAMIIVTSERILFLRIKQDNSPIGTLSQASYTDIASCKRTGFGQVLQFAYTSGRIERFSSMPARSSKKLIQVLKTLIPGDRVTDQGRRQYICPRCNGKLTEGRYSCPNCSLQFKDPASTLKHALLYPGGGFFYLRKRFFGFQHAVSELFLIGLLLVALLDVIDDPASTGLAIVAAILLLLTKTIHAVHARSCAGEFVPITGDYSVNSV